MDPALKAHLHKLTALPTFRPLRPVLGRSPGCAAHKPLTGPVPPRDSSAGLCRPRSLDPQTIFVALAVQREGDAGCLADAGPGRGLEQAPGTRSRGD